MLPVSRFRRLYNTYYKLPVSMFTCDKRQHVVIYSINADMPPGTDCPNPIRILAFFEMIRPYHVVIRI